MNSFSNIGRRKQAPQLGMPQSTIMMTGKHFYLLILIAYFMVIALPTTASATDLLISLRTNYRPGIDFIAVRTTITKPNGVVVRQPVEKSIFTTSDTENEFHIAKFDLPNGSYIWIVTLFDQNERVVKEKRSSFELGSEPLGDIALITTLTLPRTCSEKLLRAEADLLGAQTRLQSTQIELSKCVGDRTEPPPQQTGCPAKCPQQAACECPHQAACPPKCSQQAACGCPRQAACPPKCPHQAACPPKCPQEPTTPTEPQYPTEHPKPDLVPVNPEPSRGAEGFCRRSASGDKLIVTVKNQGVADAIPSRLSVHFLDEVAAATQPVGFTAPGGSYDKQFDIPSSCNTRGCNFRIRVDSERQVDESDETNNVDVGFCPAYDLR